MKNLNDFDEPFLFDDDGIKRDIITKGDRKAILYKLLGFIFMLICIWIITYTTSFEEGIGYSYIPASIVYITAICLVSNKRVIYLLELMKVVCVREENNLKIPNVVREQRAYDQITALFLK